MEYFVGYSAVRGYPLVVSLVSSPNSSHETLHFFVCIVS